MFHNKQHIDFNQDDIIGTLEDFYGDKKKGIWPHDFNDEQMTIKDKSKMKLNLELKVTKIKVQDAEELGRFFFKYFEPYDV